LTLPTTLNSGVFVIRPLESKYLPLFLYWILLSEYFEKFLNKLKAGSTINHLYQKDFINFYFPIPSLAEQQKIASILSGVDATIEATQKTIEKTERLKKGLMQQLLTRGINHKKFKRAKWYFGKEIEIPKEWNFTKLEKITKVTDGAHYSPPKIVNGFPLATVENVKANTIDIDSCYQISKEDYEQLVKSGNKPSVGDVLFTKDGTVGKTLVFRQRNLILLSSIAIIQKIRKIRFRLL